MFDVVENYRLFVLPTVKAFHTPAAIYSQHVFEWQERGRDVTRAINAAHAAQRHINFRASCVTLVWVPSFGKNRNIAVSPASFQQI